MSAAQLRQAGQHRWEISGSLDLETVPQLWQQMQGRLQQGVWVLDLSRVDGANSAGLALLLEAHGEALRQGAELRLRGLPGGLRQLGEMCGLGPWLEQMTAV